MSESKAELPRSGAAAEPAAAPAAEAPAEPLADPPASFALPGGREVVGRGLDLSLRATKQLRPASLYIGLLLLGLIGPAALFGAFIVAREPAFFDALFSGDRAVRPPEELASAFGILFVLASVAVIGALVVAVEGSLIATALLGGQHVGRPLTLRQGVVRSRQAFWRIVRGSIVLSLWLLLVENTVLTILGHPFGAAQSPDTALETTILGLVAGLPFVYLHSGIVLGDAGALESLRRSVRLARARWRLALVIGLFSAASTYLALFGLGAGSDVLGRIADALHLSFVADPGRAVLSGALLLAAIVALGSLLFTVAAIVAAPQVVAFIGLTHYSAGLDLARLAPLGVAAVPPEAAVTGPTSAWSVPPPGPSTFRWVTRPMLATIVLSVLLALVGVASVTGVGR